MNNIDTIHALRSAAHEIRSLRRQVLEVKAEAWDVHSEIIKRLFSGPVGASICSAHMAEKIAEELERMPPPIDNAFVAPGCEQFAEASGSNDEMMSRTPNQKEP